jgi:hypothetical protein
MKLRTKFWLEQKPMIEKKIQEGMNVRTIAKEYGVTFQRLYLVCEEIGIDIQYYFDKRVAERREVRLRAKQEADRLRKEAHKQWYLTYWADLHGRRPRKKAYHNQPTEGVAESVLEARRRTQEYNKRNRLKLMCRRVFNHAVDMEWIVKGVCSVCGSLDHIEGHHEDYYKPFQVIWICKHHHHQLYHSGSKHHRSK